MTKTSTKKSLSDTHNYDELYVDMLRNKSAMIRFLTKEGYDRSKIAKFMNIRYQHVRNVQLQPLKKETNK